MMTGVILSINETVSIERAAQTAVASLRDRLSEGWPELASRLAEHEFFYRVLQDEIAASLKETARDR